MRQVYILLAFDSTHTALRSEELLAGLDVRMMPTLREISASCGISLRLPPGRRAEAERRLQQAGLRGWRSYQGCAEGKKPVCTLLYASGGPGKPAENP